MELRQLSDRLWGYTVSPHQNPCMAFYIPDSWARVATGEPRPQDPFAPLAAFDAGHCRLAASLLWLPRLAQTKDLLEALLALAGATHVQHRDGVDESFVEAMLRSPQGLHRVRLVRDGAFVFRLDALTHQHDWADHEALARIFDSFRLRRPGLPTEASAEITQGPVAFQIPAAWRCASTISTAGEDSLLFRDPSSGWIRTTLSPRQASPVGIAQSFAAWCRSHGAVLRGAPVVNVSPEVPWLRQFVYAPLADRGPSPLWAGLTIREGANCWHSVGFLGLPRLVNPWKAAILKAAAGKVLESARH
ncbi:MAG: hypothetical protein JNK87_11825 [Bryobacterales bacterium]|nr:hypothetical protein [Bryobacterales bacterium]